MCWLNDLWPLDFRPNDVLRTPALSISYFVLGEASTISVSEVKENTKEASSNESAITKSQADLVSHADAGNISGTFTIQNLMAVISTVS
jgi:hypothetical protein